MQTPLFYVNTFFSLQKSRLFTNSNYIKESKQYNLTELTANQWSMVITQSRNWYYQPFCSSEYYSFIFIINNYFKYIQIKNQPEVFKDRFHGTLSGSEATHFSSTG